MYQVVVVEVVGGAKALVTGQAGKALGERGVRLVENQTGQAFDLVPPQSGRPSPRMVWLGICRA